MKKNQKKWTDQEILFLKNNLHLTDRQIGDQLGRSNYSICGKRRNYINKTNFNIKYDIDINFFKNWNNEMAYVLGFIYADGSIRIRESGFELKIKIKDKLLLEGIKKILKCNNPIKEEIISSGIIYFLNISRKEIVEDLMKLGLTQKKSLTMEFPIFSDEFLFDFVRGYFDGDGSTSILRNYLNIDFTCGSKHFLEKLHEKLLDHGIDNSIYSNKRLNEYYSLKIMAKSRKLFFKLLYKDAKIYLDRKFKIMKKYFDLDILQSNCVLCEKIIMKRTNSQKYCKNCSIDARMESYRRYDIKRGKKRF